MPAFTFHFLITEHQTTSSKIMTTSTQTQAEPSVGTHMALMDNAPPNESVSEPTTKSTVTTNTETGNKSCSSVHCATTAVDQPRFPVNLSFSTVINIEPATRPQTLNPPTLAAVNTGHYQQNPNQVEKLDFQSVKAGGTRDNVTFLDLDSSKRISQECEMKEEKDSFEGNYFPSFNLIVLFLIMLGYLLLRYPNCYNLYVDKYEICIIFNQNN